MLGVVTSRHPPCKASRALHCRDPFQHAQSLSLALKNLLCIIIHSNACHPCPLSASPPSVLPLFRSRLPALQSGASIQRPLLSSPHTIHSAPPTHEHSSLPLASCLPSDSTTHPTSRSYVLPRFAYTPLHLSSHRALNHPPHVVHPTRGVPSLVSLVALPGVVVIHNALTVLSMPLDVHPYSINSPGFLPSRRQVPSAAI